MDLPPPASGLAAGALQPALGPPVNVACQEIPAGPAVLGGVSLRQRRHRAARSGLGIFPGLAGILVALGQHVGGSVAGKGKVGIGWRRRLYLGRAKRTRQVLVVQPSETVAARQGAAAGP